LPAVKIHTPAVVASVMPECPIELDGVAAAEWDRYGPILLKGGRLTEESAPAFALYCDTWGRYVKASENVRTQGATLTSSTKYGEVVKPNPAAAVAHQCLAALIRLGSDFGLTPMGCRRVGPIDTAAVDDLEALNEEFAEDLGALNEDPSQIPAECRRRGRLHSFLAPPAAGRSVAGRSAVAALPVDRAHVYGRRPGVHPCPGLCALTHLSGLPGAPGSPGRPSVKDASPPAQVSGG